MSLDVTAHLCNDKQLIFKMLFFSFSSYCGEGEEGAWTRRNDPFLQGEN